LRSICEDDDQLWYPQRHVCHATAAQQNASRKFHTMHREAKPDVAGYLPTDGHMVWASDQDLTPDDDFLSDSSAPTGYPANDQGDPYKQ
jgi:hypothetical protein